jgi:pimeloyl-ACP methyl ester carboxylesterase
VHRTVTTPDGVDLFTHEIGPADAPPVVVLHGGPAAHHDYLLPAFGRLAVQFRLIFYDQRGGGRSRVATPGTDLSLAAHLADLAAVLDAFALARADLVGYSFGGFLSMLFAARRPERVRRLALASSAPPHQGYRPALDRAMAEAARSPWVVAEREALERSGLRESLPDEHRRRRFALSVAGYFADPRLAYGLTPFRVTARAADLLRAELGERDFSNEIDNLDGTRTLFLHGDRDPIDAALLEAVARRIGARFERIAGSGHVPYLEAPDPFFSILRGFLGAPP